MDGEMTYTSQETLKNQPKLVYMWIAHYNDNTSLPQFDLYSFKENAFKDINEDKLIKFGLYPFPPTLANNLRKNGYFAISIPFLPTYEIEIKKPQRLIHYRETYLSEETYHVCKSCKKEFFTSIDHKMFGKKYKSPICPHCGAHDYFKCKSCGKIYQNIEDAPNNMCECGHYLERKIITSTQYSREKRWIIYHLGTQETIKGINKKTIIRIQENGDCNIIVE